MSSRDIHFLKDKAIAIKRTWPAQSSLHEEAKLKKENPRSRLNVFSIWVGILIPILAAVIPYGIKRFSPEHRLEYEITGPVVVDKVSMFAIKLRNSGEKSERNVQVTLRPNVFPVLFNQKQDISVPDITVDPKNKYKITTNGEYQIINLGDIRPDEDITVSILLRGSLFFFPTSVGGQDYFSIKSEDHVARAKGKNEFLEFIYPVGFWIFVILMVFGGVYSIYYEYFMDAVTKEKMILSQIDKLKK